MYTVSKMFEMCIIQHKAGQITISVQNTFCFVDEGTGIVESV
jgi:hypothetical protein